MTKFFFISQLEWAFKMMKNGIYFIVVELFRQVRGLVTLGCGHKMI